jgi:uncharacterized protein
MQVLITGGTGLLGQALSEALIGQGHNVTVLSRNPQKYAAEMPGVDLVAWDGRTPEGWGHLIETTDAVVNLAGTNIAGEGIVEIFTQRWTDAYKQRILQSRLDVGQALVQAIEAAEHKPQVLVQASTVGYYGPRGSEEVREDSPPGNDFQARVPVQWEETTKAVEAWGVRRAIIRTGLVMTKEGGILPMMLLPFRLFVGGPLGSGKQGIPWIHVEDEIQAIIFLLQNETAQGAYNLTAPNPVSYKEFSRVAGKVMKRPSFIPVPSFAIKLALGEKAALVLEGRFAVPGRLLEAGYKFSFSELEPALRDLLS